MGGGGGGSHPTGQWAGCMTGSGGDKGYEGIYIYGDVWPGSYIDISRHTNSISTTPYLIMVQQTNQGDTKSICGGMYI